MKCYILFCIYCETHDPLEIRGLEITELILLQVNFKCVLRNHYLNNVYQTFILNAFTGV